MDLARLPLTALICLLVVLLSLGYAMILAAVFWSGPIGIALTTIGIGGIALAWRFENTRFEGRFMEVLVLLVGSIGSLMPIAAVLLAPAPWMLVGIAGYAIAWADTLVYKAVQAKLDRSARQREDRGPDENRDQR